MDPNATIKHVLNELKEARIASAYDDWGFYRDWRNNGGFAADPQLLGELARTVRGMNLSAIRYVAWLDEIDMHLHAAVIVP